MQSVVKSFTIPYQEAYITIYEVPSTFLIPMSNSSNSFDCLLSQDFLSNIPIEYLRLILTYLECLGIFIVITIF